MRTTIPSPEEISRKWWVVDASGLPIGRLASVVAYYLRGKHKAYYTPFLDTGDHVIVVNSDKAVLTGKKSQQKMYRRHSGYPGGLREVSAERMMAQRPERAVEVAIKGMLPKGPLGRKMYTKLKVYRGADHPHQAQKPEPLASKALDKVRNA